MTNEAKFQLCLEQAQRIVAAARAEAPEGCDPQNTSAILGVGGTIVLGTTLAAGAGASAYAAHQAGKAGAANRGVGELSGLPYDQQLEQAQAYADADFQNKQRYMQMMLGMNPAFQQQQLNNSNASAKAALRLYPQFAGAERAATTKTREADLSDLLGMGGRAQDAYAAGSPGYASLLREIAAGDRSSPLLGKLNFDALTADRGPISRELERSALTELALGRSLSAEETRDATQSARGAWSARGLGMSNPAIGAEILNRDAYGREREAGRRQYAMGVEGLLVNEDEANRRFGLNVEGMNMGQTAQRQNFKLAASQATNAPLQGILGTRAPGGTMGNVLGAMGLGMPAGAPGAAAAGAPSIYQGVQALTPLYSYGADVFNTNFNAGESRQIRKANAYAGIGSGLMSLGGSMGGAAIGGM